MARAKAKQKGKVDYEKVVWVLDNLTTDDLALHDKAPLEAPQILENLMTLSDDGFRITCKYDRFSKAYMASATCVDLGHDNSGLAIAARGADIKDCLSIVMYKYFTIADRDLRGFTDKVPVGVRG